MIAPDSTIRTRRGSREIDADRGGRGGHVARWLPVGLACILVVTTVLAFSALRAEEHDQERLLLHERSGEVAALFTNSVTQVRTSLDLLGSVYAASPSDQRVLSESAGALMRNGVVAIDVVRGGGALFTPVAAIGAGAPVGHSLDGEELTLVQRAVAAHDLVSQISGPATAPDRHLAFAYCPLRRPRRVRGDGARAGARRAGGRELAVRRAGGRGVRGAARIPTRCS